MKKYEHKPSNVSWIDIEELACQILNLDYDKVEHDDIEQAIFDKFECSMDNFQSIVEHLLPLADSGVSPLTKEGYRGFSVPADKKGVRAWVIKEKI